MAKKLICCILALAMVCGLCACGETDKTPQDADAHQAVAERFLKAYYTRDRLSLFPLYFYDAEQKWEDEVIADTGSVDAFLKEAQKQADDRGIEAKVDSLDSYHAAYHQFILNDLKNMYGEYTLTTQVTQSKKLDNDLLNNYRDKQLAAIDEKYIDADAFAAITEAYLTTVNIQIKGEKKDYSENYLVYLVYHDGQWLVVSHSI